MTAAAPRAPSASPSANSRGENRFIECSLFVGGDAVASLGCLRLERARPLAEVEPVAAEEHRQHVFARCQEDAANLVAREQLPVEVATLVCGRNPVDIELVHLHDGGSIG